MSEDISDDTTVPVPNLQSTVPPDRQTQADSCGLHDPYGIQTHQVQVDNAARCHWATASTTLPR